MTSTHPTGTDLARARLPAVAPPAPIPPAAAAPAVAVAATPVSASDALLRLQRHRGNHHVGRLLQREPAHAGETAAAASHGGPDAVERAIDQARGAGQGLDHRTRDRMESAFGADFGGVRIHTDTRADGLNHALSARAFATGSDVFFRQGEYDPGSSRGRELLAHELTHVVQQTGAGPVPQAKMTVSEPDDPQEQEADRMAQAVMRMEQDDGAAPAPPPSRAAAGLARSPLIQRRTGEAEPAPATPATAVPAAPVAAVPSTGDAAVPAGTVPPANVQPTTSMTLTALAEDIPGVGKDRIKSKEGDDAIWFSPISIKSSSPVVMASSSTKGVLAGTGEQTVAQTSVPVTGGTDSHGLGSVSVRLRYADTATRSISVDVTGTKNKTEAKKKARAFVNQRMTELGDIAQLQGETAVDLERQGFAGAQVALDIALSHTKDVGETTFFYLARNAPLIQMRITAAKVGEKKTTSESSTTTTEGTKTDDETHRDGSSESVEIDAYESMVKTLDDQIKQTETKRTELISNLSDVVVDDKNYRKESRAESKTVKGTYKDSSKNVHGHSEEGDKDKKNWAAWGREIIEILQDVTAIPGIDRIPGAKKVLRVLGGWELELIDKGLGFFEEKGTVHYKDSDENTTVHSKNGGQDTTTQRDDTTVKVQDRSERKRVLTEHITAFSKLEWSRYTQEINNRKSHYRSLAQKNAQGGSNRVVKDANQSTTVHFAAQSTLVLSKPVLEARLLNEGGGEVANVAFVEKAPTPATQDTTPVKP